MPRRRAGRRTHATLPRCAARAVARATPTQRARHSATQRIVPFIETYNVPTGAFLHRERGTGEHSNGRTADRESSKKQPPTPTRARARRVAVLESKAAFEAARPRLAGAGHAAANGGQRLGARRTDAPAATVTFFEGTFDFRSVLLSPFRSAEKTVFFFTFFLVGERKEEEDHRPFFRAAGSARVAAAKRGAIQCSAAARRGAFVVGIREIQTQKNGGKFEIGFGASGANGV